MTESVELSDMTKKELVEMAEDLGLSTSGTKSELIARILDGADESPVEEPVEEPAEEAVEEPEPVAEEPEPVAEEPAVPVKKASARERVRICWRLTQGGGQPPALLWEKHTTDLALGRVTEDQLKDIFRNL